MKKDGESLSAALGANSELPHRCRESGNSSFAEREERQSFVDSRLAPRCRRRNRDPQRAAAGSISRLPEVPDPERLPSRRQLLHNGARSSKMNVWQQDKTPRSGRAISEKVGRVPSKTFGLPSSGGSPSQQPTEGPSVPPVPLSGKLEAPSPKWSVISIPCSPSRRCAFPSPEHGKPHVSMSLITVMMPPYTFTLLVPTTHVLST